jgi:two-component system OmpR family sensor kinase
MGRLFWKFFLFIWLAQMAGIFATGALFWLDRQRLEARLDQGPAPESRPPPQPMADGRPPRPPPPDHRPPPLPVLHMIAGLLASLLCAAGLAWYIAKPVRHLRTAFEATAEGNLDTRIADRMGSRRDELADLARDFDRMTERLRALRDGQRRLLHDVSHELRSPLARLQAAIGLARQQPTRLEETLQRIERESERMNRLIGEVLTLARFESGGDAVESVDLGELLGDLVEDARFEAAARAVVVDYPQAPGLRVRANGELLQRALENVLRNALRFSPTGSALRVELLPLGVAHCRVVILDRGPGVPQDELEAIFTPFFRGSGQDAGYGLGLAIARRVLAAASGQIRAQNRAGGGLRVEIELPLAAP